VEEFLGIRMEMEGWEGRERMGIVNEGEGLMAMGVDGDDEIEEQGEIKAEEEFCRMWGRRSPY
jgi:hypothetical protein